MSPNIRDVRGTKRPAKTFTAPAKQIESIQWVFIDIRRWERKKYENTIATIILNIFLVTIFFVA